MCWGHQNAFIVGGIAWDQLKTAIIASTVLLAPTRHLILVAQSQDSVMLFLSSE